MIESEKKLDAVREKLARHLHEFDTRTFEAPASWETLCRTGFADGYRENASEILALLESEQGGGLVRRDHEAMNRLRTELQATSLTGFVYTPDDFGDLCLIMDDSGQTVADPTDAILGTPTESGGDDE